jgi:SAM-dependent methyltransferase
VSELDYPPGFFKRTDETPDPSFYGFDRLVTHIDDRAIGAVGALYSELALASGRVLDLMSSWVSHFESSPAALTVLGMNERELRANPMATDVVVHDLNTDPALPFADECFDSATCCVSVDYLVRPIEVFRDVARVLVPGGTFVCTFSNRCFPTKAIHGWLQASEEQRCAIVVDYFDRAGGWKPATSERRTPPFTYGDPLYAVWSTRQ